MTGKGHPFLLGLDLFVMNLPNTVARYGIFSTLVRVFLCIFLVFGVITLMLEWIPVLFWSLRRRFMNSRKRTQHYDKDRKIVSLSFQEQALQKEKERAEEVRKQKAEKRAQAQLKQDQAREEEISKSNTIIYSAKECLKQTKKRESFKKQKKGKKNKKQETEAAVQERRIQLEEEPTTEDVKSKKAVQLRFRMPNGETRRRNFLKTSLLSQLFLFCESEFPFLIENEYIIISGYPRRQYDKRTESLVANEIENSLSLLVELV